MPSIVTVGTSGGNKDVGSITVGTSGGNRAVLTGTIGTSGGNKVFYAALSASVFPTTADGSGTTLSITTSSTTCTASDGSGSYTFAWTQVSGGSVVANSPVSATTTFTAAAMTVGETRFAVFRCTVTDTVTTATASADVSSFVERTP